MSSSLNSETFGGPSASSIKKSADLTHAKSNVGTRVLSTSSLVFSQIITFSLCRYYCVSISNQSIFFPCFIVLKIIFSIFSTWSTM